MKKSFIEELNRQIEIAIEKYNQAKAEAIKNLSDDNIYSGVHDHVEFGAAYVTHIDKVSIYAAKIKTLNEVKALYNHFENQAEE